MGAFVQLWENSDDVGLEASAETYRHGDQGLEDSAKARSLGAAADMPWIAIGSAGWSDPGSQIATR